MCMCIVFIFTAYTYNTLIKNSIENIYVFESNYILNIVVCNVKVYNNGASITNICD